uniref:FAS1 domain-containing protein n=1 Tax=Chromera velia CCMP2878 TaxID=1169474 RepID=A0A0G4F6X4_9ALVE|eukprot:Cvel_15529.t1-p1 / transcript=Cvel_15529.t1 / gene=Cvel_15529 / organism=Chromera_velia_CCMP2878 / gene_product=hypothetical protein / transcript_product=hypothetical protein / location=Cvel_scaffold1153:38826-41962(-) / protein_length=857 / sequence_SO=supercontig / SO=protein_coding / is_pseudo=false
MRGLPVLFLLALASAAPDSLPGQEADGTMPRTYPVLFEGRSDTLVFEALLARLNVSESLEQSVTLAAPSDDAFARALGAALTPSNPDKATPTPVSTVLPLLKELYTEEQLRYLTGYHVLFPSEESSLSGPSPALHSEGEDLFVGGARVSAKVETEAETDGDMEAPQMTLLVVEDVLIPPGLTPISTSRVNSEGVSTVEALIALIKGASETQTALSLASAESTAPLTGQTVTALAAPSSSSSASSEEKQNSLPRSEDPFLRMQFALFKNWFLAEQSKLATEVTEATEQNMQLSTRPATSVEVQPAPTPTPTTVATVSEPAPAPVTAAEETEEEPTPTPVTVVEETQEEPAPAPVVSTPEEETQEVEPLSGADEEVELDREVQMREAETAEVEGEAEAQEEAEVEVVTEEITNERALPFSRGSLTGQRSDGVPFSPNEIRREGGDSSPSSSSPENAPASLARFDSWMESEAAQRVFTQVAEEEEQEPEAVSETPVNAEEESVVVEEEKELQPRVERIVVEENQGEEEAEPASAPAPAAFEEELLWPELEPGATVIENFSPSPSVSPQETQPALSEEEETPPPIVDVSPAVVPSPSPSPSPVSTPSPSPAPSPVSTPSPAPSVVEEEVEEAEEPEGVWEGGFLYADVGVPLRPSTNATTTNAAIPTPTPSSLDLTPETEETQTETAVAVAEASEEIEGVPHPTVTQGIPHPTATQGNPHPTAGRPIPHPAATAAVSSSPSSSATPASAQYVPVPIGGFTYSVPVSSSPTPLYSVPSYGSSSGSSGGALLSSPRGSTAVRTGGGSFSSSPSRFTYSSFPSTASNSRPFLSTSTRSSSSSSSSFRCPAGFRPICLAGRCSCF